VCVYVKERKILRSLGNFFAFINFRHFNFACKPAHKFIFTNISLHFHSSRTRSTIYFPLFVSFMYCESANKWILFYTRSNMAFFCLVQFRNCTFHFLFTSSQFDSHGANWSKDFLFVKFSFLCENERKCPEKFFIFERSVRIIFQAREFFSHWK
jgi:hypothetical protein